MMNTSLGILTVMLCAAIIASARPEAVAMDTNPNNTQSPTTTILAERRENTTPGSPALVENKMEVTTGVVTRSLPHRTTQHRKRHAMHTVRTVPRTNTERGLVNNVARKDQVQAEVGHKVAMPRHVDNNSTHFLKRTTREPQNFPTTDEPLWNSTFLSSSFARLQRGGISLQRGGILSSPVCPAFCCSVNVSCHYTYDIHLKPRCGCTDTANGTNTCSVPGSSDMSWMPVLQRPPWVQGTCMGSWTERESDNTTGLKLHCHVDQVDDFTFTVVHWNVSPPGGAFPFRPCIVFVHVNNTEPAHYVKTTVDIVIQYFGFGLIFLFIGVIMSSCKNIKA
ncbi:uncharacterized protein LOC144885247 [Branchiostoma floridae x Branchiostoma japonicum]